MFHNSWMNQKMKAETTELGSNCNSELDHTNEISDAKSSDINTLSKYSQT